MNEATYRSHQSVTLLEDANRHFTTAPPSVPITAEVVCRPSHKNDRVVQPAFRRVVARGTLQLGEGIVETTQKNVQATFPPGFCYCKTPILTVKTRRAQRVLVLAYEDAGKVSFGTTLQLAASRFERFRVCVPCARLLNSVGLWCPLLGRYVPPPRAIDILPPDTGGCSSATKTKAGLCVHGHGGKKNRSKPALSGVQHANF